MSTSPHAPRLLDEWQVAPELWNQVRRAVDAADQSGQFLLTGSAVPAADASRHSGAGRFSVMRLRKAAKRHFVDPSLALAATGASAERLLEDVAWFGQVLHYPDDYGIEVDAAATNVKRFAAQIDSQRSGSPAFLAVICGKGYGYRRADGVMVVRHRRLWIHVVFLMRSVGWLRSVSGGGVNLRLKSDSEV